MTRFLKSIKNIYGGSGSNNEWTPILTKEEKSQRKRRQALYNDKSKYCLTLKQNKENACNRPIEGINNKDISCYNGKAILDCPWKRNLLKQNFRLSDKQQLLGAKNCYKCANLREQLTNDCVDIARRVSLHDRGAISFAEHTGLICSKNNMSNTPTPNPILRPSTGQGGKKSKQKANIAFPTFLSSPSSSSRRPFRQASSKKAAGLGYKQKKKKTTKRRSKKSKKT